MSGTVLAALIGLIGALIGLIGGALAVYFAQRRHNQTREDEAQRREEDARRREEQAHRREAVAYLMSITEAIRGMREKLAKSEIPYDFGHEFDGLLDDEYYEGLLQPYLGAETQPQLEKLLHIHARTLGPDNALESGDEVDPEELRKLLADMQRIEGDVRVQARRISPTESRAN